MATNAYPCDGQREGGHSRNLRALRQILLGFELPGLPDMGSWARKPLPANVIKLAALGAHVLSPP